MNRKPIFDAIRDQRGGTFTEDEVRLIDALLDKLGIISASRPASVEAKHKLRDAQVFFSVVRKLTGPLDQVQADTINNLLLSAAHWPVGWVAYGLATAWHEARLKPIAEIGKGRGHKYGMPGQYGGQVPYGRGLVQLTWDFNYRWADEILGLNGKLLANFDLALDPDIATRILVVGMETGAFTGRGLAGYIGQRGTQGEFVAARHIINGTDRAKLIAGYAVRFQDALEAGGWS